MRNVVCGVGSILRGDDGFGPAVVKSLAKKKSRDTLFLDCGSAPENFIGLIEKESPERIIVLDSTDMQKPPGTVGRIPLEKISPHLATTHKMPLLVFIERLKKSTGAEIVFIGCQPESLDFNEAMSRKCRKAVESAKNMVVDIMRGGTKAFLQGS